MINKYLNDDDLNKLYCKFNSNLFKNVDYKNLELIISFLEEKKVYYIKEMILDYFDLFIINYDSFVNKFNKLCNSLGEDAIDKISNDMSLLEELAE